MARSAFACPDCGMAHNVPIATRNGLSRQACKLANITLSRPAKRILHGRPVPVEQLMQLGTSINLTLNFSDHDNGRFVSLLFLF